MAAPIRFKSAPNGNYRLVPGSNGTGRSIALPNLWAYNRAAPGAWPLGENSGDLPIRPLPVRLSRERIEFIAPDRLTPQSFTANVAPGTNFAQEYRIRISPEADYIRVTPDRGYLKSGETQEFILTIDPGKLKRARRYADAVLLRFANGVSRPLSVHTDLRDSREHRKMERNDFFLSETAEKLENASYYRRNGDGILQLDKDDAAPPLIWTFEVPADGRYYLFNQIRTTGIELNLLEFSVDQDAWGALRASHGPLFNLRWRPFKRLQKRAGKNFESFMLKKGKHTLTIRGLRPVELKAVAITNNINQIYR